MRHLYRLVLLILTVLIVAACQNNGEDEVIPPTRISSVATQVTDPTTPPTSIPPTSLPTQTPLPTPRDRAVSIADQAYIRFVHTIVGLDDVDVFVSGRAIARHFKYLSLTQLTEIEAGNYTIHIVADEQTLIEQPLEIQGRQTLTIIMSGTPDTPITNVYVEDTTPLNANQTRVQLINAVPGGPAIQAQANGIALTPRPLEFNQNTSYVIIPSENTLFTILENEQLLTSKQVTVRERHNYTIVFVGNPVDPSTYDVMMFYTSVPGIATVRAVSAAEVSTPLDIYVNGELLFGSVDYSHTTHRQNIPTGSYTTEVFPTGTPYGAGSPLTTITLNANADSNVTLIILGIDDKIQLIRHDDDLTPVAPETARITFVHAAPQVNGVRLFIGDTPPLGMSDLAKYQLSPNIILDADQSYTFDWVSIGSNGDLVGSVETSMDIQIQDGQSYIYLMNARGGAGPILFNEEVGTDETLLAIDAAPTEAPVQPAYVRVVNALTTDITVDFFIDDIPLMAAVPNKQLSDPILVSSGVRKVSIRPAGVDSNQSISHEFEFIENGDYTIYAYGSDTETTNFRVFTNASMVEGDTGTLVRLINLTQEDRKAVFDLAYVEGELNLVTPSMSDAPPFREALPLGTTKLFNDVSPESASAFTNVASIPGDFYIIDTQIDLVATTLLDVPLEAGTQYDIVAYQIIGSTQVIAYIIAY